MGYLCSNLFDRNTIFNLLLICTLILDVGGDLKEEKFYFVCSVCLSSHKKKKRKKKLENGDSAAVHGVSLRSSPLDGAI